MVHYLDTSFVALTVLPDQGPVEQRALYLKRRESARQAIQVAMDEGAVYSSELIDVELYRVVVRHGLSEQKMAGVRERLRMLPIASEVLKLAKGLVKELRTLDAIHLASALLLNSPEAPVTMLTHDRRMSIAARDHGLEVVDLFDVGA